MSYTDDRVIECVTWGWYSPKGKGALIHVLLCWLCGSTHTAKNHIDNMTSMNQVDYNRFSFQDALFIEIPTCFPEVNSSITTWLIKWNMFLCLLFYVVWMAGCGWMGLFCTSFHVWLRGACCSFEMPRKKDCGSVVLSRCWRSSH